MYYRDFFYQAYFSSRGFCPTWPIGRQMYLGDMIKLLPGEMNKIGNIYTDLPHYKPKIETMEYPAVPNRWEFQQGLYIDYSAPDVQVINENVQVPSQDPLLRLKFGKVGSYFFQANSIDISRIANFDKIENELIKHLTTETFSFESIYIVTEVAHVDPYSFLLAREDLGELLLKVPHFSGFMPLDLNHMREKYTTLYTRGLDQVHLEKPGANMFFRAMKLQINEKMRDQIIRTVYQNAKPDGYHFIQNIIDNALKDMVSRQDIDPMNANEFFSFDMMSMDDVAIFLGDAVEFYY